MFIEWDNTYSVGVKVIDEQHFKLVEYTNDYGKDMLEGIGLKKTILLFQELAAYAKYHFKTEEDMMIKYSFPDYDSHKKIHDEFSANLAMSIKRFQEGEFLIGHEIHKYLREWLMDHILDHTMEADRELGVFLNEKGVY